MSDLRSPSIDVVVDLNADWASGVLDDTGVADEARAAVEDAITKVASSLAVPCRPEVRLRRGEPSVLDERWPVRPRIGGVRCGYPADVFGRVSSFSLGVPLPIRSEPVAAPGAADAPAFLAALCSEIVKLDPRPLIGREQTEALASAVFEAGGDDTISSDLLAEILRTLLGIGIAVPPPDVLAESVRAHEPAEVAESLVAERSADAVEIHVTRGYLEQLTLRDDKDVDSMAYLREAIMSELGIPLPPFHFVPTNAVPDGHFALKLNDVVMTPWLGLRPDQLLVDSPSREVGGEAAANPASSTENSLVDASRIGELERDGLTYWDPFEYLVLCVATTTRLFGYRLVNARALAARAAEVEFLVPELVAAALDSDRSRAEVTRLLRFLVAEGISIGNVKLILDAVVEQRVLRGATDGDESGLLEYVRTRLKWQVKRKVAGDADAVVAYVIDPAIEALLDSSTGDDAVDRVLSAMWAEIRMLPPSTVVPAVLTSSDVRPRLRRCIGGDLPAMAVIAEDELPISTNVQPVARVMLT
jgi:flagellar biosynthesis component FlhA